MQHPDILTRSRPKCEVMVVLSRLSQPRMTPAFSRQGPTANRVLLVGTVYRTGVDTEQLPVRDITLSGPTMQFHRRRPLVRFEMCVLLALRHDRINCDSSCIRCMHAWGPMYTYYSSCSNKIWTLLAVVTTDEVVFSCAPRLQSAMRIHSSPAGVCLMHGSSRCRQRGKSQK